MNFGFSPEQELLRREVRKLLDERCPLEQVRRIGQTPDGYSRPLWKQMGELGFLGLALPEAVGGAGLGWVDLVVLLEEVGRSLLPSPLLSTVLAGAAILDAGSDAQRRRWLPGLASGARIGAVALLDEGGLEPGALRLAGRPDAGGFVLDGRKPVVADAAQSDLFVVAFRSGTGERDVSLAVLEAGAPGLEVRERASIDPTRRVGELALSGVRAAPEALLGAAGAAWPAIARALDRGAVAVTAEMIGAAEGALALTVSYAQVRHQFGRPIGHFQGVKHPLAERFVEIESLRSLLYYAAWALDKAPERVPLAASEAKAFGTLAFSRVGIDAVQLHGAVGYTEEHDAHLFLKRSKWARPMYGDEDHHHDRIAALGGYGWTST